MRRMTKIRRGRAIELKEREKTKGGGRGKSGGRIVGRRKEGRR